MLPTMGRHLGPGGKARPRARARHRVRDSRTNKTVAARVANCVGKNLATLEMRTVLALLITRFDFHLVSDYDLEDWNREQEDFFAMKNGRLPVVIRRRI